MSRLYFRTWCISLLYMQLMLLPSIVFLSYVMNDEGTDPYPPDSKHGSNCFHCDGFFTSTENESWQKVHGVDSDDAAIVIANALIGLDCAHKHLNIPALHFNDTVTEVGYKALAYALAVNTSLLTITMMQDECSGACASDDEWDDWENVPYKDSSNGLFEKALQHNPSTNLQNMELCYNAFGKRTLLRLTSLLSENKDNTKKQRRS